MFRLTQLASIVLLATASNSIHAQETEVDLNNNDCAVVATDSYLEAFAVFEWDCTPYDESVPATFTFIKDLVGGDCLVEGAPYRDIFEQFEISCTPYEEQPDGTNFVIVKNVIQNMPTVVIDQTPADTPEISDSPTPVSSNGNAFPVEIPEGQCAAFATRNNFTDYCPGYEAMDCDVIDGDMVCASFGIGDNNPVSHSEYLASLPPVVIVPDPLPEPTPTVTPTTPTVTPVTPVATVDPVGSSLLRTISVNTSLVPGGRSWTDSFIGVDNQCWPRTGFDHGIDSIFVTTGSGQTLNLVDAINLLGNQNTYPAIQGDLEFNTVGCGQLPSDAGDEQQCPGLTTRGNAGCGIIGNVPMWWERI